MMKQPTRSVVGGKRGHCSVGAVHGGKGNDPMLPLLQEFNLPVTREDYLNLAYLGPPSEAIVRRRRRRICRKRSARFENARRDSRSTVGRAGARMLFYTVE